MITIVKFRCFDKALEKVFYQRETPEQIHKALRDICFTYVATEVITAFDDVQNTRALEHLKLLQP